VAARTPTAYEEMALFDEHSWGGAEPAAVLGPDTGACDSRPLIRLRARLPMRESTTTMT